MAVDYLSDLCSVSLFSIPKISGINNVYALVSMFFIVFMLLVEWLNRDKLFGLDLKNVKKTYIRYGLYGMILFSIYFFGNNSSDFIYFQF